jgi:hypothetical protein
VQNFNFGFQAQVSKDTLVELDWRGSTGPPACGGLASPNQIDPKELSRGAVLTQTISSQAQASAAGLPYPYAGFSGLGAYTLLPFPQMQGRGLGALAIRWASAPIIRSTSLRPSACRTEFSRIWPTLREELEQRR